MVRSYAFPLWDALAAIALAPSTVDPTANAAARVVTISARMPGYCLLA